MKYEIPFRINVTDPLAGVAMRVQRGKQELLEPEEGVDGKRFEFNIRVDLTGGEPNFLGPYAQGPKGLRFVYVNSGRAAGQINTEWSRRAKLSLMSISSDMVEQVVSTPGARMETTLNGAGPDGGPVCASVRGLKWAVAK